MGISCIIAGFVFFFLPNLSIIDILPDFIGCLLIIKGLSKFADLTPGIQDARERFIKLTYFFIAKFVLSFTVPFFANNGNDGGYILIFTFAFGLFDLIFTLPAFKALHDGFTYLGDRTNASVLFQHQSEFASLTNVFLVARAVLALIPDLSYISNPEISGTLSSVDDAFYISNYKTLLTGINFLVVGFIGIAWLVYSVRYFTNIKKDKKFMTFLQTKYENEVLTNKGLFIRRSVKLAFFMLTFAAFSSYDLYIDFVNVVPDILSAFFILISCAVLKKYVKIKSFFITSVIYFITSVLSWAMMTNYAVKFPAVNIWNNYEAYELFIVVNIFNVIKYVALASVLFVLYRVVGSVINDHTGTSIDELKTISAAAVRKQKEFRMQNTIVLVLGLLMVISGIARIMLMYYFGDYVVFDALICIIYAGYTAKTLNSVYSAVEYKYI